MIRYILVLIFLWLLTACSPVQKLKRAEKLIEEAGELGAKWHSDTVKTTVEVIQPEIQIRTVTKILPGDTVIREKVNYVQKIIRLPGDSIIVETIVKADTVYKEVPVTVTRTISAGYSKWQMIGSVLGAVLFVVLMGVAAYKLLGLTRKTGSNPTTN